MIGWWLAAQAVVAGTESTDEAVVAFVQRPLCSDDFTVTCTGTLIAPDVVLTAAHCIRGATEVHVGAPIGQGRFIKVASAVAHPMFDDATDAYDLAIVRLAESVDDVTPIALPTLTLDAAPVGSTVRVVGYGVTGAGAVTDGERRTGTMQMSAVNERTFTTTPAPSNSCGGDSGGPVFAGEQLIGITVSGDPTCMVNAVNARLDISVEDFVRPTMNAPAPRTPTPAAPMCPGEDDGCSTTGSASAWLALAVPLLARRSRRRKQV